MILNVIGGCHSTPLVLLVMIDFYKINLGFNYEIKMEVKTTNKGFSTNVISMLLELDYVSSYMMLDEHVFKMLF
jgi:hypothetical protein